MGKTSHYQELETCDDPSVSSSVTINLITNTVETPNLKINVKDQLEKEFISRSNSSATSSCDISSFTAILRRAYVPGNHNEENMSSETHCASVASTASYTECFKELFDYTPSDHVICPTRLKYRDSYSGLLTESIYPVTDNFDMPNKLLGISNDYFLPRRSSGSLYHSDPRKAFKAGIKTQHILETNSILSFHSESTEKKLARSGFFRNQPSLTPSSQAEFQFKETIDSNTQVMNNSIIEDRTLIDKVLKTVQGSFNIQSDLKNIFEVPEKDCQEVFERELPSGKSPKGQRIHKSSPPLKVLDMNTGNVKRMHKYITKRERRAERCGKNKRKKVLTKKSILAKHSGLHCRKKASGPRKKTGCWTCRLRRKKCSEEKPACAECIRLGIQCYGYGGERPEFMKNPELGKKMKEGIKKITLTQKRRGYKQRYIQRAHQVSDSKDNK